MLSESFERVVYRNPPIEEGLCQLHFGRPLDWSVATPGLLYEHLRKDYPEQPEAQEQLAASVQVPGGETGASFAVNRGPQRFIFRDPTATRLVVAGAGNFSVNSLRPYEGWPALRGRLSSVYSVFREVFDLPPITQVSVRYINRIVVPKGDRQVNTDDYFRVSVQTAENGRASFLGFLHRVGSMLSDDRTRVQSTFSTLEAPAEEVHFLLDLELVRPVGELTDIDEILSEADDLKRNENREFESCITDEARRLFE